MAEPYKPSKRIRSAAATERKRVDREIARVDRRERDLLDRLADIQETRAGLELERDALSHFADADKTTAAASPSGAPHLRAVPDAGARLRGPRIREQAIRVLVAARHGDCPIHYRDWYEMLVAAGYVATGEKPLATFLTQIRRSPLVNATDTKGVYVVDLEVLPRNRARLGTLTAQLQAYRIPQNASADALRTAREGRDALVADIRRLERDIDEIERSMNPAAPQDVGALSAAHTPPLTIGESR